MAPSSSPPPPSSSSTPSPPTSTPPPSTTHSTLSFPAPHVLLVTIARERAMNSIPYAGHWELERVFDWFDGEPQLRTAIITGAGRRAFCAGQDLIELGRLRAMPAGERPPQATLRHPPGGFAGVSRRVGRKPIIAAVNGLALGGGFEIVLNCDMVVAAPNAVFGLPEALRGIYAGAGGPPRLVRIVGLPVASEIALTGVPISAQRALELRLINRVSATQESVVSEALELARRIAELSPDSAIVTKAGLREALETAGVERATQLVLDRFTQRLHEGENAMEGLMAFAEKRKPNWKPSKL